MIANMPAFDFIHFYIFWPLVAVVSVIIAICGKDDKKEDTDDND